jgi:hypothetical protein
MSEVSQILPTQVPAGEISDVSLKPDNEPAPEKPAKYKPRFAEFKCSHREVSLEHVLYSSDHLLVTFRYPDLQLQ